MKKDRSIVETAFSSIENVISTVETIHGDIAETRGDKNGNKSRKAERRKNVYGVIKSINGNIGALVSDFFKPGPHIRQG